MYARRQSFFACPFLLLLLVLSPLVSAQSVIFSPRVQDIGAIKQEEGIHKVAFSYRYTGTKTTYLERVESACHCLGMEREYAPIVPSDQGTVCLHFLPAYHIGVFEEEVKMFFRSAPAATVHITGSVIPLSAHTARYFPFSQGSLRFPWQALHMGVMHNNRRYTQNFLLYNTGKEPLRLKTTASLPAHLDVSFHPVLLAAKAVGNLTIHYHPLRRGSLGYALDTLRLQTNDEKLPLKTLYVAGTIAEGTTPKKRYGRLFFPQHEQSFGRVRAGQRVRLVFPFENTGKENLEIYETHASCGCLHTELSTHLLLPGERGTLTVRLKTAKVVGRQRGIVHFFSNDPIFPVQNVVIEGYVARK